MKTKKIWLWDDNLQRMQLRVFDSDAVVAPPEGYVCTPKSLLTEYMTLASLTEKLFVMLVPELGPVVATDTAAIAANISKKVKS